MADASFEEFARGSLGGLGRYAYALTGGAQAAEDLVQDTLVKVAGAWRRVQRDGNPVGYARTVMFRTYVSNWRRVRRRPPTVAYHEQPADRDPYAEADARDALRRALAGLPPLQRAVLVLGYLDDATDTEIAAAIGRKPATVRSLRQRGLAALRGQLADRLVTPEEDRCGQR